MCHRWALFRRDPLHGVRPCSVHTFEDQLGLVPSTKSKIEDGSDTGTSGGEVVTVADFRKRLPSAPSWSPVFRIPHGRRRIHLQPPWQESMDG